MSKPAALILAALAALPAAAHERFRPAPQPVSITVRVDGSESPLYPAPDGSGRLYFEARRGADYAIRLDNRSGERVGVCLAVDGLDVISGQLQGPGRGRMYVLDPWGSTEVRGWRTSLQEIRQFTFVEEARSYAVRSGQANGKLGWIEAAVYRERQRPEVRVAPDEGRWWPGFEERDRDDSAGTRKRDQPTAPAGEASAKAQSRSEQSFPGTGWGRRSDDRAVLVDFEAESEPCQRLTLRYEYAPALRALGILPDRDRLGQRERGENGFARPPAW